MLYAGLSYLHMCTLIIKFNSIQFNSVVFFIVLDYVVGYSECLHMDLLFLLIFLLSVWTK